MSDTERQPIIDTTDTTRVVAARPKYCTILGFTTVIVVVIVVLGVLVGVFIPRANGKGTFSTRVERLLRAVPLIDGHNDLAVQIRSHAKNQFGSFDLRQNLTDVWPGSHTDIPRLRQGMVGGQFWSCYAGCSSQYKDGVQLGLDQCDTVRRVIEAYQDTFLFVDNANDIHTAFDQGLIASMLGLEGGHMIGNSLATLRQFYRLGVRYLTLTHTCNTPWADSSPGDGTDQPGEHEGLTTWGKLVVQELNRLGMLVDLSHVSKDTMLDALNVTEAPVIFSHSSAWALCHHHRNVQDEVLRKLKDNNGIIMVNFFPEFVNCPPMNSTTTTVNTVANHIDHIRNVTGVDHIGIGADYDGVGSMPIGLEDVSKYPALFEELFNRGWNEKDLKKLAGENLIRVFKDAEQVRDRIAKDGVQPNNQLIPNDDLSQDSQTCRTDF